MTKYYLKNVKKEKDLGTGFFLNPILLVVKKKGTSPDFLLFSPLLGEVKKKK